MSSVKQNEIEYNTLIAELQNEIVLLTTKLTKKTEEYNEKFDELTKLQRKFDGIKQLFS